MTALLPLLVVVPMTAAAVLVAVPRLHRVHIAAVFAVVGGSTVAGLALVAALADGSAIAHRVGGWAPGVAIPFAADLLTALMLTVTGVLTLACAAFAVTSGRASSRYFAPLLLVLVSGVNGALLTADLFNLFVFIEVMLLPSYGLLVLARPGGAPMSQIAGARLYVTLNLLTSTVFLAGVAFVYGSAGTVNLAELAGVAAQDGAVAFATAVCLLALGIKAAVVPVHGWLARAYPATSPAVTALFSGLHTKVAIYAIYRVYAVVFDGDSRYLGIGVLIVTVTMVVGVLGAVGESTTRSVLAFHMVSQIGYILLGVALFTELGLTAGIFYLLHHMVVKASLFLSTGAVEVRYGTGRIGSLHGIARREPLIAAAFFVAALSLAGIPPFSGFVAKLALIVAALDAGQVTAVVAMVVVSLVTLLSMLKIWGGVFWGSDPADRPAPDGRTPGAPASGDGVLAVAVEAPGTTRTRIGTRLALPAVALAAVTVVLGLGGELLLALARTAALGLLDPSTYLEAVLTS